MMYIRNARLAQSIFAAAGIILIAAFYIDWAAQFMRAEHSIYGWDSVGPWKTGADLINQPDHNIIGTIAAFGRSMHHNYNDLTALPSSCVMAFWGTSRFCYIIANVVFLLMPAVFVCLWLFFGLTITRWSQALSVIMAFLALLAAPLPWRVILSGMTDVGGLVMAAIATDLLSRTDINTKSATRWLAIGAAMATTALSRRWYLFYVVGLLLVLMVELIINWIQTSLRSRSVTFSSVFSLAFGPFLCLCSFILVYQLSFPFILEILKTNYSQMDTAYKSGGSWFEEMGINAGLSIHHYGPAQFVLSFVCFIAALFFDRARRTAVYLFIPSWLALFYFSKVQNLGDHQLLVVYIATMAMPLFLARQFLSSEFKNEKAFGWAILGCAALISCLNFQSVFALRAPFAASIVQNMFSNERIQPTQRHDLGEIEAMLRYVGEKVANPPAQPPIKNVYLLSSSLLFNSSLLGTAAFQLNKPLPAQDYICETNDVDLVEGFPDALLTAKLVLVADPIQTHLYSGQKVVTVPAQVFLHGAGFTQAFTRDPRFFQLDMGVRVYVFERVRPSTPEEIEQLHEQVGVPSKKIALQADATSLRDDSR
jgi:hypothetical protein